jgi:hypothetical protein
MALSRAHDPRMQCGRKRPRSAVLQGACDAPRAAPGRWGVSYTPLPQAGKTVTGHLNRLLACLPAVSAAALALLLRCSRGFDSWFVAVVAGSRRRLASRPTHPTRELLPSVASATALRL